MAWEVIAVDEFSEWLLGQAGRVQAAMTAAVEALAEFGPQLGRPLVDTLHGSAFDNMKELRFHVGGRPYRVLFAFDPKRRAILLIGGDKGKDKRWYKVNVPVADDRLRRHLASIEKKEKDDGDPVR